MKRICYIAFPVFLLFSCNGPNPEGTAQEERRDSTAYYHTSFPATKDKDSRITDTGSKAAAGIADSIR